LYKLGCFQDFCDILDELTDVVTSYVSLCVDTVILVKKSKVSLTINHEFINI